MSRNENKPKLSVVRAELKRIEKAHGGRLRAVHVVEAARPRAAALHSYFEWRDGLAAEKFRLLQAERLIRITVDVFEVNGKQRSYRAYVSLSSDRMSKQGYRTMTAVMSNPAWRSVLLEDAKAELRAFQLKYRGLVELAAVFDAVNALD
jgi:hypothetical protein